MTKRRLHFSQAFEKFIKIILLIIVEIYPLLSRDLQSILLRTFNSRNICINCFIFDTKKHPSVSIRPSIKCNTPNPPQLSLEYTLCTECFGLLENRVNMGEDSILPALGHSSICFPCGKSILRAQRTYPVQQNREESNILTRLVPLHLISRMERVCATCMRSAIGQAQWQQQHDANHPYDALSNEINAPAPYLDDFFNEDDE